MFFLEGYYEDKIYIECLDQYLVGIKVNIQVMLVVI